MMSIKTFNELVNYKTFEERFEYLKLPGQVGLDTFGNDRWINQNFYRSKEWKDIRHRVIIRDNGCDLAITENLIYGPIIIHHINPITLEDFSNNTNKLLDLNNLICVSDSTHRAIHYGIKDYLKISGIQERKPNDTKVW